MIRLSVTAGLLLGAFPALNASAQPAPGTPFRVQSPAIPGSAPRPELRPRDLLRVTASGSPRTIIGSFLRVDGEALTLRTRPENDVVAVPLSRITGIERRVGTRSHFGGGVMFGLLAGAAVGMGYVALLSSEDGGASGADVATGGQIGGLIGAAVGGLIGVTVARSSVWEPVR